MDSADRIEAGMTAQAKADADVAEGRGPVNCNHVLRAMEQPNPRTCLRCRLGPCPFYQDDPTPPIEQSGLAGELKSRTQNMLALLDCKCGRDECTFLAARDLITDLATALTAKQSGLAGYKEVFYEIADMLDIPAQTISPREVFETQIKPRILSALTANKARDEALEEAWREPADWEMEDILASEGIYVWGPDGDRFLRMFAKLKSIRSLKGAAK